MKLWGKGKTDRKKLKVKVNGYPAQVITGSEKNEYETLDNEVQYIENVFKCLVKIDKSVSSFNEMGISLSLQCPHFCPLANKEFCRDVVILMSKELTRKMSLKTWVDTGGFIDYSR